MSDDTTLEELFNRQPPYSDADLDRIIAHCREHRANVAGGMKVKKEQGPKAASLDLVKLGLAQKAKPVKLL